MSDVDVFLNQTLMDYDIVEYLGQGAFSYVFKAIQQGTSHAVAMKVLKLSSTFEQVQEFENEGKLLIKLEGCDRIIDIYDSQVSDIEVEFTTTGTRSRIPVHFHVLELADGCLDGLIARLDELPWPERLSIYRDLVRGLHQMHHASIVHRDLKSSNCLLKIEQFDSIRGLVNDLGRARDLNEPSSASDFHYRIGRGDSNYKPPELFWGLGEDRPHFHRCADLYGLGSLLFEFITGQGITALALLPRLGEVQNDMRLPDEQRRIRYLSRQNEIRSWFETAYLAASSDIPRSIRHETVDLLRQLCDPDPGARLPRAKIGGRASIPLDLNWLLRRVDILQRRLSAAEHQEMSKKRVTR
jgi:serine/threonine protein kinase